MTDSSPPTRAETKLDEAQYLVAQACDQIQNGAQERILRCLTKRQTRLAVECLAESGEDTDA